MEKQYKIHGTQVGLVNEVNSANYDALVVITSNGVSLPNVLEDFIAEAVKFDVSLENSTEPVVLRCGRVSGVRLVLAPTGVITPYDDVRSVYEAAGRGVRRAAAAGAVRPVLVLPVLAKWPTSELVALLGALEVLYVPLQIRETFPELARGLQALGVYSEGARTAPTILLHEAIALERARGLARDIGGADPERMTPTAVADYIRAELRGLPVEMRVQNDAAAICAEYPLFAAVTRAADTVPRHRGCIIFLEYVPEKYEKTLMLVGKGVTYDTGGCDVKAGGVMAGMSRDKCGAAAIAGFIKACAKLQAPVKVVAALGMVRNSIGEEAYVADELVRCRRGLAVRVGNTDAEGRMVMGDLLAEMHERAAAERNPHLYTVATLTGHAHRAVGEGYSIVMDNHAARALNHAEKFRAAGESIADPVEISTLRREDLLAHRGRSAGDQVHQADNKPSTAVPRGHQGPAGFLLLVSGLHEKDAPPYTHVDVAASAGSLPDPPTGAPLLALAAYAGLLRSI